MKIILKAFIFALVVIPAAAHADQFIASEDPSTTFHNEPTQSDTSHCEMQKLQCLVDGANALTGSTYTSDDVSLDEIAIDLMHYVFYGDGENRADAVNTLYAVCEEIYNACMSNEGY